MRKAWLKMVAGGLLAAFGWFGLGGCGRPIERCRWVESVPVISAVAEDGNAKDDRSEMFPQIVMRSGGWGEWRRRMNGESDDGGSAKDREIRRRLDTVVLKEDYDFTTTGLFLDEVGELGQFNVIRDVDPDILDLEVYLPVKGWTLRQALDKLRDITYDVRNEALVVTAPPSMK